MKPLPEPTTSALIKPLLPRGLADRLSQEIAATRRMIEVIGRVYELYGFCAVETPLIEYTEALGKFLPDTDRPNAGVFSFKDDDQQWLSLRYDLTAPLARHFAAQVATLPKPYRSWRAGFVFRNEKPGAGRFRQFMQCDADTIGAGGVAADAEICMMAADTLEALGVPRGQYIVKVNNRKVLDDVLDASGLAGDAPRRLIALRAIDKFDRLGASGVRELLGAGRRDASGDFTKGVGLDVAGTEILMDFLRGHLPKGLVSAGLDELAAISELLKAGGYGSDRVRIDMSVVRGLEYYTGPVFEAELTFEVSAAGDQPMRFGAVGGGGRYDGLVGRFQTESVPATGFSIGVSRLYAALKALGSPIIESTALPMPVLVLVMDKDFMPQYQGLVAALRRAHVAAELYLGTGGMNAQLKYADRRGAPCAIIQGSNERASGQVVIKDLVLGATLGGATKDRADYLELKQMAQFAVAESEMVGAVRSVLSRQAANGKP